MKKALSLVVALMMLMALCACSIQVDVTMDDAAAPAADGYVVTLINGMDGSVYGEYDVAAGEDFVFSISCAAPCDMGPYADGEIGSGVTASCGTVTYSNVTTGGPNAYPTAETVTVSGIDSDCTVTVTPNPDEVGSVFPTITLGEAPASASGEASGEASDEASAEPASEEPASEEPAAPAAGDKSEAAYQEYLHEWLIAEDEVNDTMTEDIRENEFMPLIYAGDYETFPAEMLWNGMLNNGSPMTFEEWAAQP